MSNGYNKVILIGNVCSEPNYKELQNGAVLNFRLACNDSYKTRDGERKETCEFVNCTLFGQKATSLEKWINKGTLLLVEGKLRTRSYEVDGVKKYATEVNVFSLNLLPSGQRKEKTETTDDGESEDGLPF